MKDKDGNDLYVKQLCWDDFAWRTGAEVYSKLKTLKIQADGIIDLSEAIDC